LDLLLLQRIRQMLPDFADFRRLEFSAEEGEQAQSATASDEAAEAAFTAFFAMFCRGSSVCMSHHEEVPYPVLLRRRGGNAREADLEELLRRFDNVAAAARPPEDWQIVLNAGHPLVDSLLGMHLRNRGDPLLAKACELLAQQTSWKFGLATGEERGEFLAQTEDFLTWICRQHVGMNVNT
jgi:hypothetical protein